LSDRTPDGTCAARARRLSRTTQAPDRAENVIQGGELVHYLVGAHFGGPIDACGVQGGAQNQHGHVGGRASAAAAHGVSTVPAAVVLRVEDRLCAHLQTCPVPLEVVNGSTFATSATDPFSLSRRLHAGCCIRPSENHLLGTVVNRGAGAQRTGRGTACTSGQSGSGAQAGSSPGMTKSSTKSSIT
jgi:hypothetical protein